MDIDFFDELYVGVRGRAAFDVQNFPLAFATPMGGDAAFRKRRETVDGWVGGNSTLKLDQNGNPVKDLNGRNVYINNGAYQGNIVKNTPIDGFQFERSVSRWSTSNKWFEINDPRGFTLQISAENLGEILTTAAIDRGQLKGKYIWGRTGGNNWLAAIDNPAYIKHLQPKEDYKPQIGDYIKSRSTGEQQYLGKFYMYKRENVTEYFNPQTQNWSTSYDYYSRNQTRTVVKETRDPKPWIVFGSIDYKGGVRFSYSRSFGTKYEVTQKSQPLLSAVPLGVSMKDHVGYSAAVTILFETKNEVLSFDFATAIPVVCPTCNGAKKVPNPIHSWMDTCPTCNGHDMFRLP